MIKYSIIIPTYNHLEDCLKPCLKSLFVYTDLSEVEVIIVANGCTDGTREWLLDIHEKKHVSVLWFDEPLGFTKAANAGAAIAQGEYIIFLNNDTQLLEQGTNQWLQMLEQPFLETSRMGITGPLKLLCSPYSTMEFIVGFCMMTKKYLWNEFGPFDEIWSPGAGEDTEYCIKVQRAGYLIQQVPNEFKEPNHDSKFWVNHFPIYHKGEGTMHDDKIAWQKVYDQNGERLKTRYPEIYGRNGILCEICTKGRYTTTLPMTISSVIHQTRKPDYLIIYDDTDEPVDMRTIPILYMLFQTLDRVGIGWHVIYGAKKGQTHNHQAANKAGWKYVWRIDDDEVAEPSVLDDLFGYIESGELHGKKVGAVGGLVLSPDTKGRTSSKNKIEEIYSEPNIQWFEHDDLYPVEVDHLYSSFLYRAGIVDYDLNCPGLHREETIFSYLFKEKGYRCVVMPGVRTWHYRNPEGGIRNEPSSKFAADELNFEKRMEEWGYKLIVLNCGLGDHLMFLNIMPELIKKYKKLIISCCYPEVFNDYPTIKIVSIECIPEAVRYHHDVYRWCTEHNWKGHLIEAYQQMYDTHLPLVQEI